MMNVPTRDSSAADKILVAEDSPTQAERLRRILENQSYEVTVTVNGREALDAARRQKPALLLTDIVMPEMDGYELCREMKNDPQLVDVPVILVTTLSDPEDVIRGLECHADNFILKPYDERYLVDRVHHVLANRRIPREERSRKGVEIVFHDRRHFITADRVQILNLLLSTYDAAIQRNRDLLTTQEELRRVNEQLASTNAELDAFSFSVSHDLRSPLASISLLAQLIQRFSGAKLDTRTTEALDGIVNGIARMSRLIDDLLSFARMARKELERTEVNLGQLVGEVLLELGPTVAERHIEWRIASLPVVIGDAAMLRQVIVNYLSNAIKYSRQRDPAVIEVGSDDSPGEWVIFVRDNGAGFDMEHAQRLFGAFQRLHRGEEFEGTGVGLSNVRRIINRHGGRTWAESAVDQGATFYFSLPRHDS